MFTALAGAFSARAEFGDRITISDREFRAGTNLIWINGADTPWHKWNDFGRGFDASWWDKQFQKLHENGINATRVWISCNGEVGINISADGRVWGCTQAFWKDLDSLFHIAQQRRVYVMATLMSFDHFSDKHPNHMRWRKMINDTNNVESLVTNYVVPFVNRYKANPWLWSIDLCNEPDWIHENAECGRMPWEPVQSYFATASAAIHANGGPLVTVGFAMGSSISPRHALPTCSVTARCRPWLAATRERMLTSTLRIIMTGRGDSPSTLFTFHPLLMGCPGTTPHSLANSRRKEPPGIQRQKTIRALIKTAGRA